MPPPTSTPTAHTVAPLGLGRGFAYAIPLFIVVVFVGAYAFVFRGQFAELRELRSRRAVEETVDVRRAHVQAMEAARAAFDGVDAEDRRAIDAFAPGGEDVPGLFAAMDAAAQRAGVAIATIEVAREDPPSDIPALAGNRVLTVGASIRNADYPRLKAFLDILARSRRLMDVRSVQFSPESLTATVRVWAYTIN